MDQTEIEQYIDDMPDAALDHMVASMPWADPLGGGEATVVDEEGFPIQTNAYIESQSFHALQTEIWRKFVFNPQINSYIRDYMGRLTGKGFEMGSGNPVVAEKMKEIIVDPRNALYKNMSKFTARSEIEGELFICLSVHSNGFVEVDFMDPRTLTGNGTDSSGIYYHKLKANFPLWYEFDVSNGSSLEDTAVIPSINIAYFPELKNSYRDFDELLARNLKLSRTRSRKYNKIGGFKRFIVEWDKGYLTPRNVSHLRTTIVWINHYENLKKWEIDHKRSSGSYLWVAYIEDHKALRTWLKMTDEQKAGTGLMAKKKPGGTLVLPPGVKLECINPNLPSISDTDTDIMNMVVSGLNTPEDMVTGVTKGSTFSGVKASRGPQADRISDQIEYFERFLVYDFWRPIFHLSSAVSSFPKTIKVKEVVDYKNKKPVKKSVSKDAWELVSVEFPVSEIADLESAAKAMLGVKHGPLNEVLGIPNEVIARKLGFGSYHNKRLAADTERETYPDLLNSYEVEKKAEMSGEVQQDPKKPNENAPKKTEQTDDEKK